MAIKAYKPTTPGRRGMTSEDMSMVTHKKGLKSLMRIKKSTAGRNNTGRITTRPVSYTHLTLPTIYSV